MLVLLPSCGGGGGMVRIVDREYKVVERVGRCCCCSWIVGIVVVGVLDGMESLVVVGNGSYCWMEWVHTAVGGMILDCCC